MRTARCGSGRPLAPATCAAVGIVDGDDGRRLAQPVGGEHRHAELVPANAARIGLGAVGAAGPHLVERREVARRDRRRCVASEWSSAGGPFHVVTRSSRIHSATPVGVDAVHDHRAPAGLDGEQRGEHLHVEDREREAVALAQAGAVAAAAPRAPRPASAGCTGCAPRPSGGRSCRSCRRCPRARTGRRRRRSARRARRPSRRATARPSPASRTTTRHAVDLAELLGGRRRRTGAATSRCRRAGTASRAARARG